MMDEMVGTMFYLQYKWSSFESRELTETDKGKARD